MANIVTTTDTSTAAIVTTTTTSFTTTTICSLQYQQLFTIDYNIDIHSINDHTMIATITSLHVDSIQCMCIARDIYVCIYARYMC